MNAAALFQRAAAEGVHIAADGADLILEAETGDVPADLIAQARAAKPELLALLSPASGAWNVADWRSFFDERAGMAELDGKMSRSVAEARAYQYCLAEWLSQNPPPLSTPDLCAACGRPETPGAAVVPYGTGPHTWLHPECWQGWFQARNSEANRALAVLGVTAPNNTSNDFGKTGA